MKHARRDYDRIQDPGYTDHKGILHKIPDDEPVFLIRAQDICAIPMLRYYVHKAYEMGAKSNIIDSVAYQIMVIEEWQKTHATKIPDM